jgi:DNA-binding Lrp family transcriptional regulator
MAISKIDKNSEKESENMKTVELRLMAELMKNSRRSDRDLAKAVGVSQPTIGRTIKKLEKEGYIKEYTPISLQRMFRMKKSRKNEN